MKKKGFTLIELLAVIVILAIIAVITVPKIADMITSSRQGAADDSFYGILKAAELSFSKSLQTNNNLSETVCTFDNGVSCTNGVNLSASGKLPAKGKIEVTTNNTVGSVLEFNGYICSGDSKTKYPCRKNKVTPAGCFTTSENSDGSLSITSYDASCGTDVTIPESINGKNVTVIAEGKGWQEGITNTSKEIGAFANRNITSVVIPDTVTDIGGYTFYSNKIKQLHLGSSVRYIGSETFKNNQIETLIIPASLKRINAIAFANNSLRSINLPNTVTTVGDGAFTKNKVAGEDAFIYVNDNTILNSYAGDGKGEVLNIPSTVKTIAGSSFRDIYNDDLVINIPEGVTTIDRSAFGWCRVKEINVPSTVTNMNSGAFYRMSGGTINVNRVANAIAGAPWEALNANVNWIGTK